MKHRVDKRSGNRLSVLGFGCMRLPRNLSGIDLAKSEKLVLTAIDQGVNYFDCAYVYPGSEQVLGTILNKHGKRDEVFIATKLPLIKCQAYEDFERLFQVQLERLKTDHIDYYLMHNLADMAEWGRLCGLGAERWIEKKKACGQIRQVGFSFHGNQGEFMKLLDAYDWDFCQIQYNYVNEHHQAGRAGLLRAADKGLPVIIMEPLLGGRLAKGLPAKAVRAFAAADGGRTPAQWALRWLWDQPEVSVVLSGMNDEAQVAQNISAAQDAEPGMLTERERAVYKEALGAFNESFKVPCTGCNYCMPCPQNINIPACFLAYNMSYAIGRVHGIIQYATGVGGFTLDRSPRRCIQCGQCERKCPQHIRVADELQNVLGRVEPLWMRAAFSVVTGGLAKKV